MLVAASAYRVELGTAGPLGVQVEHRPGKREASRWWIAAAIDDHLSACSAARPAWISEAMRTPSDQATGPT
jgi:hypothetical protein